MSALAAIHVGVKQLGLDEDAAREMYARVTGKRSLRDMSEGERRKVVAHLRESGFSAGSASSRRPLSGRYAPILQALWVSAWNLGIIRNRDDKALIAFVARQTTIEHLSWVRDRDDAMKAIEALKSWMRRESGDPRLFRHDRAAPGWRNDPRAQVVMAQWDILKRADATPAASLEAWRPGVTGALASLDGEQLIDVQRDLGRLVREARQA